MHHSTEMIEVTESRRIAFATAQFFGAKWAAGGRWDADLEDSLCKAGKLSDDDGLRAQSERMLDDPKAQRFAEDFAAQWLDLREIRLTHPNERLYPEFDQFVLESIIGETHAFLDEMVRRNLPARSVIDTDFARVNAESGKVDWKQIDAAFPESRETIKYHYEYQPVVHDTVRNRLIQLKGDENRVDVFTRPLGTDGKWRQLETAGTAAIGREAVFIPRHNAVLWLGKQLYVFDCQTNRMQKLDVDLPEGRYGHECAMVYDPKHNVCVALIPSRFSGPMQTFLFRYEPRDSASK